MTEPTNSRADEPSETDPSIADDLAKLWAALGVMVGDLGATAHTVAPACNGLTWCPLCSQQSAESVFTRSSRSPLKCGQVTVIGSFLRAEE